MDKRAFAKIQESVEVPEYCWRKHSPRLDALIKLVKTGGGDCYVKCEDINARHQGT